ncbi:hypothetical protein KKF25_01930, partial [Patescibacteria group bacterium]|nr:hypothetical protein [Patescibacteria group bacterium]
MLFVILILIILAAIGAVFYNWQQAKILIEADTSPAATLSPQRTQSQEPMPLSETIQPTPTYQKPAEDTVIKMPVFNYHHIRP